MKEPCALAGRDRISRMVLNDGRCGSVTVSQVGNSWTGGFSSGRGMGMSNSGVSVGTCSQVGTQQTWDLGFCGKIPSEDCPSKPNSPGQRWRSGLTSLLISLLPPSSDICSGTHPPTHKPTAVPDVFGALLGSGDIQR